MEVILLESIRKVGNSGAVANVKDGYGRYLLRYKKAMRATEEAKELFEQKKEEIEQQNAVKREEARLLAASIEGAKFTLARQAAEDGKLFGSVSAKEIVQVINSDKDLTLDRYSVMLNKPIKFLGDYKIIVSPHVDVSVEIEISVIRLE